ncbi:hypothetical protein JHK82_027259 [Glycine max]|nr:hypothetical protein JHK82_027259 [Glycine max]
MERNRGFKRMERNENGKRRVEKQWEIERVRSKIQNETTRKKPSNRYPPTLSTVMSRKENLISKLHTKKGTWKIVVRIIDMWHVNKHNGRQTIEMVLMDQMGAKIGTTLWQELFPEFEPKLHCGCAYLIQNIKVVDNHSEYKDEPSIGKSPAVGAETSSQDYQPTSADYDLGKIVFVAPTKRMYDQQGNSEFEFDEYTSYQLLTNKHIKAE